MIDPIVAFNKILNWLMGNIWLVVILAAVLFTDYKLWKWFKKKKRRLEEIEVGKTNPERS